MKAKIILLKNKLFHRSTLLNLDIGISHLALQIFVAAKKTDTKRDACCPNKTKNGYDPMTNRMFHFSSSMHAACLRLHLWSKQTYSKDVMVQEDFLSSINKQRIVLFSIFMNLTKRPPDAFMLFENKTKRHYQQTIRKSFIAHSFWVTSRNGERKMKSHDRKLYSNH